MELAVNETLITKPMFFKAMAAADHYRRSALRSMGWIAVLWCIFLVVTILIDGSGILAMGELFLLILIGIWLVFLMPRSKYRRAFKVLQRRCNGDLHRTTKFYEDYCTTTSGGVDVVVEYNEITAIEQLPKLLVITCQDKSGLMLSKNGFTKGNCALVLNLIEAAKAKPIVVDEE